MDKIIISKWRIAETKWEIIRIRKKVIVLESQSSEVKLTLEFILLKLKILDRMGLGRS